MTSPSYGDTGPIAALATPLAESALALIRTAGGGGYFSEGSHSAIDLLARVFSRPRKLRSAPPNSIVHGWIVQPPAPPHAPGGTGSCASCGTDSGATCGTDSGAGCGVGKKVDEVLVSVYRAPRSYTGEDGADISCHGGVATAKAVMAALKTAGFREALPGEFTFRAFMNGKLDLTRAESVMELVSAKTHRGREQALRRLAGALHKEVCAIKDSLVKVLAGTEIYLDYSEDEFSAAQPGATASDEEAGRLPERALAEEAASRLAALADLWRRERLYAEGVLAVIAGRPNAGKSSLFNYLVREDRSIVTSAPGTTRDWIEALISVDGIPVRLADTAGLRDAGQGDEAERIGIQRSLEILDRAGLVLYVIDGAGGITPEDSEFLAKRVKAAPQTPLLVLWNKADIAPPPNHGELPAPPPGGFLAISAETGHGIPELARSITALLEAGGAGLHVEEAPGPGTVRQKELVDTALASVEEALALAGREEPLDIIAPLFRCAINALGEITGEVSGEDIFQAMFSQFCVGK
ncbi:MAG: tRNA uridine-5-carboxymethylaminomethyl(34) synthesis GTPase MnmE [Treponema sp.]|nr:tRNA uridine-5-carboxymethylaminomethyl(34) synthesis GTPase MnmE [Treponema sp.]